jgi:hypothetical protein
MPITVAARYKAWTVFARWNTGIVGSNPTWGMDVCVPLWFVLPCVQVAVLWQTDSPSKESYRLSKNIKKLEKLRGANKRR